EFWKAPGTTGDEMKKIQTTVYRLPCAGFAEKDGNFVNSARWLQWKNVALPPPGEARLDQDILAQVFLKVRELYQKEGGKFPDPILNARWPYTQPRNVQPRLVRSVRQALGRRAAPNLVERSGRPVGRQRCAGLQGRFEAVRSHGTLHHESRRNRPAVRASRRIR